MSTKAQPSIRKIVQYSDSIQQILYNPVIDNNQAIVHLPIIDYVSTTIPMVEVLIGGYSYRFMFDTGTALSVFNIQYINQTPNDSLIVMGVMESPSSIDYASAVIAQKVELAGLTLKELPMVTTYFKNDKSQTHGIIGLSLVKGFDILFDWQKHEIILITPDSTDYFLDSQYGIIQSLPVEFNTSNCLVTVESVIKGNRLELLIDSGAFATFIPTNHGFLNRVKRRKDIDILKDRKSNKKTYKKTSITLGENHYRHIKVYQTKKANSQKYNYDGILGCDVLGKQPLLLSITKEKLLFLEHKSR